MSHNFLSLMQDRFVTRAILGGCVVNINGETLDCELHQLDVDRPLSLQFRLTKPNSTEIICDFNAYHLEGGPQLYQITGASCNGIGDATLVLFDQLPDDMFEEFEEDE